ncbi:MAG: hypothetical protein QF489_10725 [Planctomycetota bacterium]|nr:hypothetical protein [Planctomycetota bacterium]
MSERTGICNKCGQRYGDIPDSVTALKVKCQVCDGIVDIPPLPKPAAPEPEAAGDKPLAAPLGDARPKTERPDKAKSIDRDVTTPAPVPTPPSAAAPKPSKPETPVKPVKPLKPVAKTKPVTPIRPVAKPKPVTPTKSVAKPEPLETVKPAQKDPTPKSQGKSEAPTYMPAEKKTSGADIIAKAKARRAAEQKRASAAKPAEKKSSAADIIAKAKAKRAAEGGHKDSTSDIIARAKAKRAAQSAKPAESKPKPQTHSRKPLDKPIAGGGRTRRPSSSGQRHAAGNRARHHRDQEEVTKSKAPIIIVCVAALAIVGGGSWYLLSGKDNPVDQGEAVNVPAETNAGDSAAAGINSNTGAAEAVDVAPATPDAVDVVPGSGSNSDIDPAVDASTEDGVDETETADNPDAPAAAKESKPSAPWNAPAPGDPVSVRGVTDYTLIKLDQVPPLPKFPGNSDDDWSDIVEDLELFLDDSGAQSNRAGKRLVEDYPRGAFPAIVNALMKVDYEDSDGQYIASSLNELLTRIGKGTNLGWTSMSNLENGSEEWKAGVLYNKKVAAGWHMMWVNKYGVDDNAWASFSSRAGAAKKAEKKAEEVVGVVGPEEDPFD